MVEFNKIIIVSLCDKWTRECAKLLAQNLDMIFCDTEELIEYELIDKNALKQIASKEYLQESERKVLKHIASFENVVVAISYDYLSKNIEILNGSSLVVYLSLSKIYIKENANPINYVAYESRSSDLKKLANVCISLRKTEPEYACVKIIEKLEELL